MSCKQYNLDKCCVQYVGSLNARNFSSNKCQRIGTRMGRYSDKSNERTPENAYEAHAQPVIWVLIWQKIAQLSIEVWDGHVILWALNPILYLATCNSIRSL